MSNYIWIGMPSVDSCVVYLQAIEDVIYMAQANINNSYCVTVIDLCVVPHADYS